MRVTHADHMLTPNVLGCQEPAAHGLSRDLLERACYSIACEACMHIMEPIAMYCYSKRVVETAAVACSREQHVCGSSGKKYVCCDHNLA